MLALNGEVNARETCIMCGVEALPRASYATIEKKTGGLRSGPRFLFNIDRSMRHLSARARDNNTPPTPTESVCDCMSADTV
jgi:hypothetical protein